MEATTTTTKVRVYSCGRCSREFTEAESDPGSDLCPRCRRRDDDELDREMWLER